MVNMSNDFTDEYLNELVDEIIDTLHWKNGFRLPT